MIISGGWWKACDRYIQAKPDKDKEAPEQRFGNRECEPVLTDAEITLRDFLRHAYLTETKPFEGENNLVLEISKPGDTVRYEKWTREYEKKHVLNTNGDMIEVNGEHIMKQVTKTIVAQDKGSSYDEDEATITRLALGTKDLLSFELSGARRR